ncbi:winged helix DNA-binding protein [Panacibacter ginsenosidivorans]|uniref:Winged helix DNA-binding protein n=1 Tax=Panacibacter ginsenosidivorans TaxID=1813871 RepID=A0A5B8VE48_9BACT|nr:winged helix DNA-binding protein [Panacibacter ginsenosidivorans]QEC69539.1 winged helix DNA-binding protein [Panacibacter ginsenosidivorans]
MNDEKNISGLIHHLSRQLTNSSNQKWTDIGYPDIRTTHVSILLRIETKENNHNIVAKQLGISRQAISKLKHELIENGYLMTSPTENNKKSETLSLTKKGRLFLDDFKKANQDLEKAFIKILSKDRFQEFKSALLTLDNYFKTK